MNKNISVDEINTCEYRTCSCDKAQAESHQQNQDKFSHKFDTKWGDETGGPSGEPKWKYNRKFTFFQMSDFQIEELGCFFESSRVFFCQFLTQFQQISSIL